MFFFFFFFFFFFLISVSLVREHQKTSAIIRFDPDLLKMTRQSSRCITVVVQNEIQIQQQSPTFICNNFHAEQALFIPVPSCSSWKHQVCNMFSFTLVLISVWHRKNMKTALFSILFHDMMIRIQRHDEVM